MTLVYVWAAFIIGFCAGSWWAGSRILRRRESIEHEALEALQGRVAKLLQYSRN